MRRYAKPMEDRPPPNLRPADEWELYCYSKAGVSIEACASFFSVSVTTANRIIAKFKEYDKRTDLTAEQLHLWYGVAEAADAIGDLISEIPAGVRDEETRNELRQAQVLLDQAVALLKRTAARFEKVEASGSEVSP